MGFSKDLKNRRFDEVCVRDPVNYKIWSNEMSECAKEIKVVQEYIIWKLPLLISKFRIDYLEIRNTLTTSVSIVFTKINVQKNILFS